MQLEPTASLGRLVVDERNGYLGICQSEKYKAHKCKWYRITDLANPALYCTKPRLDYKWRVAVDCEFVADVLSECRQIKVTIKHRMFCKHHKHGLFSSQEEWEEPGTISMMRGIINQTYASAAQNEITAWGAQLQFITESLLSQAQCAFLLPYPYNQQDIEDSYTKLSQCFTEPQQKILLEKYYHVLKESL